MIELDEELIVQGIANSYTIDQIQRYGFPCNECGSLVMPIFDTWEDTRNGRRCRVYGMSTCRCCGCLKDSPIGGVEDYVEYL